MFKKQFNKEAQTLDDYSYRTMMTEYHRRKTCERAQEETEPANPITGVPNYDILANPDYFDDFNYIPVY